jgi:hypothetical protein
MRCANAAYAVFRGPDSARLRLFLSRIAFSDLQAFTFLLTSFVSQSSNAQRRNRLLSTIALLGVIALGLASRKFPGLFPAFLGKYPGDALWALVVFIGFGLIQPGATTRRVAAYAVATSFIVEFSQLYQAPWINSIRGTTPGHLILGSTFSWKDLAVYPVGIAVGVVVELIIRNSPKSVNRRR